MNYCIFCLIFNIIIIRKLCKDFFVVYMYYNIVILDELKK